MAQHVSELGDIIKNQLNLLNKNQSWLASQCRVTKGQISHIVSGRSNPSTKLLLSLSKNLGIKCEILMQTLLPH